VHCYSTNVTKMRASNFNPTLYLLHYAFFKISIKVILTFIQIYG
jgi:hypothetical protein